MLFMEAVGGVLRAVYGLVLSIQLVNLRCSFHAAHRGVHIACLSSDRSCTRWKSCTHKDAATSSIPTHHDIDTMYMLGAPHVLKHTLVSLPTSDDDQHILLLRCEVNARHRLDAVIRVRLQ